MSATTPAAQLTPYLHDFNKDHIIKTSVIALLGLLLIGIQTVVWLSHSGNLPSNLAHLGATKTFPFFVIFCFSCIFALVYFRDGYNMRSQVFMIQANRHAQKMNLPEVVFAEFLEHAEAFIHARHQARTCLFYAGQGFFTALCLPFIFSFIPSPPYVKDWITYLSVFFGFVSLSFLLAAQFRGMRQHKELSKAFSVLRRFTTI